MEYTRRRFVTAGVMTTALLEMAYSLVGSSAQSQAPLVSAVAPQMLPGMPDRLLTAATSRPSWTATDSVVR